MKQSTVAWLSGLSVSILVFLGAQIALYLPGTLVVVGLALLPPSLPIWATPISA
jgi:hypothetical protein